MKKGGEKRTKRSSSCTMCWGKPNKAPALTNYLQSLLFCCALNWELGMETWGPALTLPCITDLYRWSLLEDLLRKHFSSAQNPLALNFGFSRHTLSLQETLCNADISLQHSSNHHYLANTERQNNWKIRKVLEFIWSPMTWEAKGQLPIPQTKQLLLNTMKEASSCPVDIY